MQIGNKLLAFRMIFLPAPSV